MSQITDGLPKPDERTARDWVTFWLRVESAIGEGQKVEFEETVLTMADLEQVRKTRREWEGRSADQKSDVKRIGTMKVMQARLA